MSEYQRFISYIYAYDGGIKVKNAGFAKMEVRDGHCRIGVNLKGAYGSSGKEEVYAVRRTETGIEKIRLGGILLRKGNGEFSYASEDGQIGDVSCRLADLCGLYVGGAAPERFYFTGWDDIPIDMKALSGDGAEAEAAVGREAETEAAPEAAVTAEEVGEVRENLQEAQNVRAAECVEKRCPFSQKRWRSEEKPPRFSEPEPAPADPEQRAWEMLCRVYPKMLSAPGQEAWELIEIHLQDIGRLPRKNWIYGNNSFLVQGYYRYGHLILARREESGRGVYWLGVPGSRDDTEKLLASMFGFREYLPGNRRHCENFGYWCAEIPLKGDGFLIDERKKGKTVDSAGHGVIQEIGGRGNEPEGV